MSLISQFATTHAIDCNENYFVSDVLKLAASLMSPILIMFCYTVETLYSAEPDTNNATVDGAIGTTKP